MLNNDHKSRIEPKFLQADSAFSLMPMVDTIVNFVGIGDSSMDLNMHYDNSKHLIPQIQFWGIRC